MRGVEEVDRRLGWGAWQPYRRPEGGGEHTISQTLTKRDIANENRYNK